MLVKFAMWTIRQGKIWLQSLEAVDQSPRWIEHPDGEFALVIIGRLAIRAAFFLQPAKRFAPKLRSARSQWQYEVSAK